MRPTRREGLVWPILAGTSLAARIRRLTFAVFGLAAVAGLALVAFVAQTGYPVLSVAPLPLPGPALTAPSDGDSPGTEGSGGYAGIGLGPAGSPLPGGDSGTISAPAAADDGILASLGSAGSTQPGLEAIPGNPGKSGLDGEQRAEVTAVTPAQQPTIPPDPALASAPVDGSSTSSALFVRTSVDPGLGEEGDLAAGAPLPPDEPEIPYEPEPEPEPPVEPEPPLEPEAEPEPPTEPEPPVEEPAEGTVEEEPVEDPAPEAPAG